MAVAVKHGVQITGSWANSSASSVCLLLPPSSSSPSYFIWIKTVVLAGHHNVSSDWSPALPLQASRLCGCCLRNWLERRYTDPKILLRFYPLKQHILLIPALRELDIDLNLLFLYSEEERFWTGGAVNRHGWAVSESDYKKSECRKEPELSGSAAHNALGS